MPTIKSHVYINRRLPKKTVLNNLKKFHTLPKPVKQTTLASIGTLFGSTVAWWVYKQLKRGESPNYVAKNLMNQQEDSKPTHESQNQKFSELQKQFYELAQQRKPLSRSYSSDTYQKKDKPQRYSLPNKTILGNHTPEFYYEIDPQTHKQIKYLIWPDGQKQRISERRPTELKPAKNKSVKKQSETIHSPDTIELNGFIFKKYNDEWAQSNNDYFFNLATWEKNFIKYLNYPDSELDIMIITGEEEDKEEDIVVYQMWSKNGITVKLDFQTINEIENALKINMNQILDDTTILKILEFGKNNIFQDFQYKQEEKRLEAEPKSKSKIPTPQPEANPKSKTLTPQPEAKPKTLTPQPEEKSRPKTPTPQFEHLEKTYKYKSAKILFDNKPQKLQSIPDFFKSYPLLFMFLNLVDFDYNKLGIKIGFKRTRLANKIKKYIENYLKPNTKNKDTKNKDIKNNQLKTIEPKFIFAATVKNMNYIEFEDAIFNKFKEERQSYLNINKIDEYIIEKSSI